MATNEDRAATLLEELGCISNDDDAEAAIAAALDAAEARGAERGRDEVVERANAAEMVRDELRVDVGWEQKRYATLRAAAERVVEEYTRWAVCDGIATLASIRAAIDALRSALAGDAPPTPAPGPDARGVCGDDPPPVCPGCHAVGEERCAPGCIDAELEAEHRHAIESGDYDRTEEA